MWLRITAYSGLCPLREVRAGEDRHKVADGITFVVHPRFSGHAQGVDAQIVYSARTRFQFDASGFSGHVVWLERLARLVKIESLDLFWRSPRPGPFSEFLDFADSDATIGARICEKLSADFARWAEPAARHHDRFFRMNYALWRHAFDVGAINGCVAFRTQAQPSRSTTSCHCHGATPRYSKALHVPGSRR